MIPNITRGGRAYGVIRYLVSESAHNKHTGPHLVAGSGDVLGVARERNLELRDVGELAWILDEPRLAAGKEVTVPARDKDGRIVARRAAHVWHCSLSLHPTEEPLGDERWQEIASEFVREMGFAGEGAAYACPWLAIRHGVSGGGNDHVHVVVGLIDAQGLVASTHFERKRSQQVCRELEQRFGLRGLTSAGRGVNSRGLQAGEVQCDKRRGRERAAVSGEGAERSGRRELERIVRACSSGADDEREFLALLRERGVSVRARYAEGGRERVVGYSVKLPDSAWLGGGRLAKDLTLPALRAGWGHGTEGEQAALEDWKHASGRPGRSPQEAREQLAARGVQWDSAIAVIGQLRGELAAGNGDEEVTARVAREGAAVLAAWSVAIDSPQSWRLARASRELARSAERPARQPSAGSTAGRPAGRGTAGELCLWLLASRGDPAAQWAVLALALMRLCADIAAVHAAQGQLARTREMEKRLRSELAAVRAVILSPPPPATRPVGRDELQPPRRPTPQQRPDRGLGR